MRLIIQSIIITTNQCRHWLVVGECNWFHSGNIYNIDDPLMVDKGVMNRDDCLEYIGCEEVADWGNSLGGRVPERG